ncbi:hypothetical protein CRG98_003838, partial [Punica granatum]
MGNTCRGTFKEKNYQGSNQPQEPSANSKRNTPSDRSISDYSPTTLNSQNLIAQEFAKENLKKESTATTNNNSNSNNNSLPVSSNKKDSIMRRGIDNQSYYVLGHKTPNIRDLYLLGRKLGQ